MPQSNTTLGSRNCAQSQSYSYRDLSWKQPQHHQNRNVKPPSKKPTCNVYMRGPSGLMKACSQNLPCTQIMENSNDVPIIKLLGHSVKMWLYSLSAGIYTRVMKETNLPLLFQQCQANRKKQKHWHRHNMQSLNREIGCMLFIVECSSQTFFYMQIKVTVLSWVTTSKLGFFFDSSSNISLHNKWKTLPRVNLVFITKVGLLNRIACMSWRLCASCTHLRWWLSSTIK